MTPPFSSRTVTSTLTRFTSERNNDLLLRCRRGDDHKQGAEAKYVHERALSGAAVDRGTPASQSPSTHTSPSAKCSFFPHRHELLEPVDRRQARFIRGSAMRRADHDRHARLADLEPADAVDHADCGGRRVARESRRRSRASSSAPAARSIRSRDAMSAGRPELLRTTPSKVITAPSVSPSRRSGERGRVDGPGSVTA